MTKQVEVILQKNQITGRYNCLNKNTNKIITYLTCGDMFNLVDSKQVINGRIEHNGNDYYWVSNSGALKKDLHDYLIGFIV